MKYLLLAVFILGAAAAGAEETAPLGTPDNPEVVFIYLREMQFAVYRYSALPGEPPFPLGEGEPLTLRAGRSYKFVLENSGLYTHEIVFGRNGFAAGGESKFDYLFENTDVEVSGRTFLDGENRSGTFYPDEDHPEDNKRYYDVFTSGIREVELNPRIRTALYLTIPASRVGNWSMTCFKPGHEGMTRPVVIEN